MFVTSSVDFHDLYWQNVFFSANSCSCHLCSWWVAQHHLSVLFHLDLFCFGGCSLTLAKFMGSLQRWWGGPAQHARVDAHAHVWAPGVRQHLKLFHIFPISQVPVIELSWITTPKKTNMFRENSSLDVDSFLKWSFFLGWFSIPSFSRGGYRYDVLTSKETASGTATTVGPGGGTATTIAVTATTTGIAAAGAVMAGAWGHREMLRRWLSKMKKGSVNNQ